MEYNLKPDMQYIDYTEESWLDERRKGIGGSDVAAILGESKYSSPLQIYKAKVDNIYNDVSDKVFVRKGKDLEGFVRNMHCVPYFKERGYDVVHPQHMFVNPDFPWLRANLDGLAIPCENEFGFRESYENNIVIEIKWVSEWAEDAWCNDLYDNVPAHYYMQVQTYMAVTGAKKAIVFALFDSSWEVKTFEVKRNEAIIARILQETEKFYKHNMLMKIPPAITASKDNKELTESVKHIDKDITRVEDAELNVLIAEYLELNSAMTDLGKQISAIKDDIIAKHLEGKCAVDNIFKVSLSACKTTRFDSTKFKADHPEMYNQYTTTSEYTRFMVK